MKQNDDEYVLFIAKSFFFLIAKFYTYWCRNFKLTANDKMGHFFETQYTMRNTNGETNLLHRPI